MRVVTHAGSSFTTKTGIRFTYTVDGDDLVTDRTSLPIGQINFEQAYRLVPFEGPRVIHRTILGPTYVWAILHDHRIRQSDW